MPQQWLSQVLPFSNVRLFGLRLVDRLQYKALPCPSLHVPTVNANSLIQGIKMVMVLEIQPRLSVTTIFGDLYSFLCIALSVFPQFPPGWNGGFASLNTHTFSATVEGNGDRAAVPDIQLSPTNFSTTRWEACRTIRVASDRIPPKLTVSFWSHSRRGGTKGVRIRVKEAIFCGIPRVSRQTLLCCN